MTKHELNACRLFLSDFPQDWSFDRILTAVENPDHKDNYWLSIWRPLEDSPRTNVVDLLVDTANFLKTQYGDPTHDS
jgi:hypothetical protein